MCVCVHISAFAHSCYKYQRWLTVSSVGLWQLLFVVVDRLLVNGWRFEVPCLSLCDGYRALVWMRIPVHGAPLSVSMHSAYVAPTGLFFWTPLGSKGHGKIKHGCFLSYWFLFVVVDGHSGVLCKATGYSACQMIPRNWHIKRGRILLTANLKGKIQSYWRLDFRTHFNAQWYILSAKWIPAHTLCAWVCGLATL